VVEGLNGQWVLNIEKQLIEFTTFDGENDITRCASQWDTVEPALRMIHRKQYIFKLTRKLGEHGGAIHEI
jgi:hypothetical protein